MSSPLYPQSVSRNLIRVSGTHYAENRRMPDADQAQSRALKAYAGASEGALGGFLPLSISTTPLSVRWLGQ